MRFTTVMADPSLLELPWEVPLEQWPVDHLVTLPRGISRHVVRFVRIDNDVYAVKEIAEQVAGREYELLRTLERLDAPAVEAVGVVSDRTTPDGEPLEAALVTKHLRFSLPYRALFSRTLRPDTLNRLLDALAVLLVRLHLHGFFWGDCSLSNTLFRRDAGAFAAYLVDAETGVLRPRLSPGQRAEDLELARVNIFGETLDLEAGGYLHPSIDPYQVCDEVVTRYERLWHELTHEQVVERGSRHELEHRMRRLNELGFDVAELAVSLVDGGERYVVRPKVVDAGHHSRRLLRLTGLDAEENQARRLLNDLDAFRVAHQLSESDEEIVAHRWLTRAFEPVVAAIPADLRGKLEPAELYHQLLDHRWYLSEAAGRDVGTAAALESYLRTVLAHRPDESAVLDPPDEGADPVP
ncbi:DUF4032 domain-containing protein [Planosporangium thailandense]|uniref:DUF4032 domain-containing protein n=1 Tax=Planosporangium thailandense TaxID=765197 RepID=A0ABX0XZ51_9ACTN|nr:DUF4032 domain-containing protein [Planosporangium thailandense]NJC70490.1 DUF4032 domain-containing protein [Planosporangium thailandense]